MRLLVLFLMFGFTVNAQDTIYLKNNSKVIAVEGSVKLNTMSKKLKYAVAGEKKSMKIKLKAVDSADFNGKKLRMFRIGNKSKGYFLIAKHENLKLAVMPSARSMVKGGFESPYTRFEFAIFNDNNAVESLTFTDVNNERNIGIRKIAEDLIRNYFDDCPNLILKLKLLQNSDNTVEVPAITELLSPPYYIKCE